MKWACKAYKVYVALRVKLLIRVVYDNGLALWKIDKVLIRVVCLGKFKDCKAKLLRFRIGVVIMPRFLISM